MQRFILTLVVCLSQGLAFADTEIKTLFGTDSSPSEVIQELISSKALQRLNEIDQSGIIRYFSDLPAFSRLEHSLGVYILLKRFNASPQECVAGLLHDVSHTVFSHVGDFIFRQGDTQEVAYQDSIHGWHLEKQDLNTILTKHSMSIAEISPHNGEFAALEQPLPDLCADRIEYNLHTAYLFKLISADQLQGIVQDLRYKDNKWYFTTSSSAKILGEISLFFTKNLWASANNQLAYYLAGQAMRRAVEIGVITSDEVHFSTDDIVLSKLEKSTDPSLRQLLKESKNPLAYYIQSSKDKATIHIQAKFRGVDPLFEKEGQLVRLSEHDSEFKGSWEKTKQFVAQGLHFSPIKKLSPESGAQ